MVLSNAKQLVANNNAVGLQVTPATLAHKEEWNGMTDR